LGKAAAHKAYNICIRLFLPNEFKLPLMPSVKRIVLADDSYNIHFFAAFPLPFQCWQVYTITVESTYTHGVL